MNENEVRERISQNLKKTKEFMGDYRVDAYSVSLPLIAEAKELTNHPSLNPTEREEFNGQIGGVEKILKITTIANYIRAMKQMYFVMEKMHVGEKAYFIAKQKYREYGFDKGPEAKNLLDDASEIRQKVFRFFISMGTTYTGEEI